MLLAHRYGRSLLTKYRMGRWQSPTHWANEPRISALWLFSPVPCSQGTDSILHLDLPVELSHWPNWIRCGTRISVIAEVSDPGNIQCKLCGQQFTAHKRLKVYIPQHFWQTSSSVKSIVIIKIPYSGTSTPWSALWGTYSKWTLSLIPSSAQIYPPSGAGPQQASLATPWILFPLMPC